MTGPTTEEWTRYLVTGDLPVPPDPELDPTATEETPTR